MPARSKVEQLPPALKAEVDRLLRDGQFSLDEVVAHLAQLGEGEDLPSRSSLGRYAKNHAALAERLRNSREVADRLVAECGPQVADGKGFQVLVQGFQSLAFDLLANIPQGETLDPENLSFLARAISSVASAQKTDTERTFKIEERAMKKAREEAATAAERVGKAAGLSADTLGAIRTAVLGVEA